MIRHTLIVILYSVAWSAHAQFTDNFSDGDFTNTPVWNGDASKFTISSGRLRLNDVAAGASYLSTTSNAIFNASWEFYVQMDFNTSSSNFTKVYLVSDQSALNGSLSGYYVAIGGNTLDEIDLYRQTGVTSVKIIDGNDNAINFSTVKAKIKVTRDASGIWSLYSDTGSSGPTGTYTLEGTANDLTHTTSNFSGVLCTYTVSRATAFWFDDFIVTGTPLPDLTPPTVSSVQINDQNNLLVSFNEVLDPSSSQLPTNYSVNNTIGNPANVTLQPDNKSVLLSLSTGLTNGLSYAIQISGVKDLALNTMALATNNFFYFVPQPVNVKDIIVSEFMADPTPVVGLPEAEFVELYNRSSNPVNLLGWKLSDGSSVATLPYYILLPSTQCVITSTTNATLFSGSLGVSNFPSLNNTGDNIILKDDTGVSIDSIHYSTPWYHSDEKKDGGWSIELIDPENLCGEETNWTASINSLGGTPGVSNSVLANNPDITAPEVTSVLVKNSATIEVLFNEKTDGGIVSASSSPSLSFASVEYSTSLRQITLVSNSAFLSSTPYTITLSNVHDCAGNGLVNENFQFVVAEAANGGDLVLNEILFNPKPNGVDFVEIYNTSDKYIDLKKWTLANYLSSTLSNQKTISTSELIIAPRSYRVFTTDIPTLTDQYPNAIESTCVDMVLPSLLDQEGTIALVDSLGTVADYFEYKESYHLPTIHEVEGVSLERVSVKDGGNDPANWRSSSESEYFATPGYKNTASYPFPSSIQAVDAGSLLVNFSGQINSTSAEVESNYSVNGNIGNPVLATIQSDNKSVLLALSKNLTNGLTYSIQISGIKDLDDSALNTASLSFSYFIAAPVNPNDIIVTEFMADPTPVVGLPEAEFVELFNRSPNPIQLSGWTLSDGSSLATLPDYILLPAKYCVITSTSNSGLFPGSLGVSSFPSLNNTGDNIILKGGTGVSIDSIHYSTSWYHSDEKKDGGWSIEIIDPENLCGEETNWTASVNSLGGTPGIVNSVQASNPDTSAPMITSVSVKNSTTIEVLFNEKMDGAIVTATSNPSLNFASIEYSSSLRLITLISNSAFLPSTHYTISLSNVSDCAGNALQNKKIEFVMTEAAEQGDLVLNEVLFNPKPNGVDFVEIYNTSDKYIDLKKWSLANYLSSTFSNQKIISTSEFIITPQSYKIFTTDIPTLKDQYPNTIESTCADMVLPSLLDQEGTIALVDSLGIVRDYFHYEESYHLPTLHDVEGVSLERISIKDATNDPTNWRSSSEPEYFATPGYKNSVSYPFVSSILVVDANTLLISFSASINSTTALSESNYSVNENIGNPTMVTIQSDNKSVLLKLPKPLINGLSYSIQISGIKDLDGSTLSAVSLNFSYFVEAPVNPSDVIITEVMADPTPVVGLPEAEFIELFNRSSNPIQLSGWTLSDGSSVATLPDYILLPSKYCVITSSSHSGLFPGSLGVSNFPTLNNTGDDIILKNESGISIDSIHYSTLWYHSDEKKDGGWSIERIDPENFCGEETNWTSSENALGGTPGTTNSVLASNPDVTPPQVESIEIKNSKTIEIVFNEKMGGATAQANSYPSVNFSSILFSGSLRQLTLTSPTPLLPSTPYSLTLSHVHDCSGNALQDSTFGFVIPEAVKAGEVVINEILFNPRPGGVDFVEIYNTSNKYLSLKKWALANYSSDSISNAKVIGMHGLVIPPKSYRVFTSDSLILKDQYPNTHESVCIDLMLPSLLDEEGSIALLDSLGNVFDYFQYKASYHQPSIDPEGVSLERISFLSKGNDPQNWKSSSEPGFFATPGYKNSVSNPFVESVEILNQNTVLIKFGRLIEPNSAQAITNYLFNQNIEHPANAAIQSDRKSVLLTLSSPLTNGVTYSLQVSGIRDPDGTLLPETTHTFLYFIQQPVNPKDVIISEFMADPSPTVGLPEAEFVELFNRSVNPINVIGWKLSDGSTTATLPQFILLPSSRCVLVSNSSAGLFAGALGISNFPSLNNTGDNIILKDASGVLMDSIHYLESWYHNQEKAEGGWSLEIIDPENFCEEEGNWTASESPSGGTPGIINSVFASNPDLTAPVLQTIIIKSPSALEIVFDEKMNGGSVPEVVFNPPVEVESVYYENSLRKLLVNTAQDFLKSNQYSITLTNTYDCAGNSLGPDTYTFVLPEVAQPGDISINEILFNPKSGGVDFVEVYNRTDKYISLRKWSLSNYENGELSNVRGIDMINPLINPHSFLVFAPDPEILKAQYPRAVGSALMKTILPSLPDDEGTIAIVDSSNTPIDHFYYRDDYHIAFLKDDEGVSLERISLNVETNIADNWRSASQFENFATPGYKNSAASNNIGIVAGEVRVEPEIFSPQVPPNDFTKINYRFDQSGIVANATIYDHQGRVIKVLANNEVLNVEGFFRWDGDRDDGARARAGYYMALLEVFDTKGSVNTFRKRVVIAYR